MRKQTVISVRMVSFAMLLFARGARGQLPPTGSRSPARPPLTRSVPDAELPSSIIQFIVTSDVHYGITRRAFRGDTGVAAYRVNAAMVTQMNALPSLTLPFDSGVASGRRVGPIAFVAVAGDIANRAEKGVQPAAESWAQFVGDFFTKLALHDAAGGRSRLFVVAGNHDISNALGYYKPMHPPRDALPAAEIYNLMLAPKIRRTAATFDYARDRAHYSVDMGGVHFAFLNLWPDSIERAWLETDLAHVNSATPVLLFAHDPPAGDARQFINPFGTHDINDVDQFENLLSETYGDPVDTSTVSATDDAKRAKGPKGTTNAAQRELAAFVKAHANIKAYFHGHNNSNEFYDWRGVDADVTLPTFRVDSPMKGAVSANDETKLSFQLVSIDTRAGVLTVRECLWNTDPARPAAGVRFGTSRTIRLR